MMDRTKVGVMGSADDALSATERSRLSELAEKLGAALAQRNCIVVTGATTGLPHLDRKSTRLNSSHIQKSRMPSSA